jgi:hypothetical protein
VTNDMLWDSKMNPMWCDSPESLRKYLRSTMETDPKRLRGCRVRTGWPFKFVSVEQYLADSGEESG